MVKILKKIPFFPNPRKKKTPILRVLTAFLRSDGINQVENQTAIKMALVDFVFKAQYSRILANIAIFMDLLSLY